jgi:hypothetical protein
MMKPVQAFGYQDHRAHIMVHMSAMQDPRIQELLQGNPMAQQMQAAMMNHINEHLGMEYRKQIELQLGFNLPPKEDEEGEDEGLNPEVEARLAPLLAQASQRLLQQNQSEAAQQKAQQQAQDPIVQMQMQELQIKVADQQRKVQKDQTDAQLRQQQIATEQARIAAQTQLEREKLQANAKLDMLKTSANMREAKDKDLVKMGVDVMKQLSMQSHQKELQRERPQPTKGKDNK